VALYAMLAYVANKCQAALMAPTEILAQQHCLTISRFLKNSRVRILPLIGGASKKDRSARLAAIAAGEADIVIGTHAIIEKDVNFPRLGLIVVDEQHKFGVLQRGSLIKKGLNPDVLIMTATPIPRTLAMSVFGDLDVSIIDEMPPGRKKIKTLWVPREKMPAAYDFIRREIRKGRQAYFVYPLVEESTDEMTKRLRAATEMARMLGEKVFPEFKVGLIHGRMTGEQKDSVMRDFREGRIQILVSTIVIEVGIDVPNATVMVIEHAERFGLSQLHQLRGRIGRGAEESHCLLFGNPGTPEGEERLKVISRTSDGFKIAEEDLRLRGPGEFFGTRQHGLPELKVANLVDDYALLRLARQDAFSIVQKKTPVEPARYGLMLKAMRNRFADMVELIGVG
jgi:ATP-dependent DNA helicase RecG